MKDNRVVHAVQAGPLVYIRLLATGVTVVIRNHLALQPNTAKNKLATK